MIRFTCDQCGRAYELPLEAAGRKAKCECGVLLTVPTRTPPHTLKQAADLAAKKAEPPLHSETLAQLTDQAHAPPPSAEPAPDPNEPPPLPPDLGAGAGGWGRSEAEPPANPGASPPPKNAGDEPDSVVPSQPSTNAAPPKERKYRNLRAYCFYLRLAANLIAIGTVLTVLGGAVETASALSQTPLTGPGLLRVALRMATTLLLPLGFGAVLYVVLKAIAEFFQVVMDIEENTRR